MKKNTLAKLLSISCATCVALGVSANLSFASAAGNRVADAEWIDAWSQGATIEYDVATGDSWFNVPSYGMRVYNENAVKLDGLKVTIAAKDYIGNTRFGFGLVPTDNALAYSLSEVTTLNVTWCPYQYAGQNRLYVNSNHADGTILYSDVECTLGTPFGVDSDNGAFIAAPTGDDAYSFTFAKVNDEVWSVTADIVKGQIWSENEQTQATPATAYFKASSIPGILNNNGECVISVWGMQDPTPFSVTFEDENTKSYKAGAYATANTAVEAYAAKAAAAADRATFDDAMAARATAESAIAVLRDNGKIEMNAKLAVSDAVIATNVQDEVKANVQAAYDAIEGSFAALDTDAGVTEDSISTARMALSQANAHYAKMKGMLSADNVMLFDALVAGYNYEIDFAIARLWVLGWESEVAALDSLTGSALNEAIVNGKAVRAAYTGSEAQRIIENVLSTGDKEALTARIQVADEAFAVVENGNSSEVKEAYLVAVESKLADVDLTLKTNIDEAKSAYANLVANVTITADDGELNTRLTAAYATIKDACEAYILAEIAGVENVLDVDYEMLSQFAPVRTKWENIHLDYLMEENATIETKYNEVKAEIEANTFFYITTTGAQVSDVERTEDGLYFEEYGTHPQRLNYNKELNLEDGVVITVRLEEIAFLNNGKAANNLCFNFLEAPNAYKSEVNGFTVMIWLFGGESQVKIYTRTGGDAHPVAEMAIPTPIDGQDLIIDVFYDANYYWILTGETLPTYVIKVGDIASTIPAEQIREVGQSADMTKAYFSMGSYMDNKENPNCYTLVSINDVEFGKETTVTPPSGDSSSSTDSNSSNGGNQDSNNGGNQGGDEGGKKKGCGSALSGGGLIALLALACGVRSLKKKENE